MTLIHLVEKTIAANRMNDLRDRGLFYLLVAQAEQQILKQRFDGPFSVHVDHVRRELPKFTRARVIDTVLLLHQTYPDLLTHMRLNPANSAFEFRIGWAMNPAPAIAQLEGDDDFDGGTE